MVEISLTDQSLHLEVKGFDKLWAFRSRLEIPLAHVRRVDANAEEARRFWKGVRAPGTHLPGVIAAGSFYQHGKWVFWDVHDPARSIAIRLHDERYAKLVIGVDDPEMTANAIRAALPAS